MKDKKFISAAYMIFAAVSAVILSIWRVFSLTDETTFSDGHYTAASKGTMTLFGFCMLIAVLACATSYFLIDDKKIRRKKSPVKSVITLLCGAAFFTAFIFGALSFGEIGLLARIAVILLLPTAAYFVCRVFVPRKTLTKALGFSPIVWAFFMLVSSYFSKDGLMTDANKILSHISFLAVMLYFVYEMRINLKIQKGRLYFVFSLICCICIFAYALPAAVAVICKILPFDYTAPVLFAECVLAGYVIYNAIFYVRAKDYNATENISETSENT